MAEGLAITGPSIAIATRGISVCQGLLSYYDDWKSYHSDIEEAHNKVASLEKTLALLKDTLGLPALEAEITVRVQECLMARNAGVESLEKKLKKLRDTKQSPTMKERMAAAWKRSTYPFRTSTLSKVKETASGLLAGLGVAIETVQLHLAATSDAKSVRCPRPSGHLV